jgi:hypothetical protein
MPSSYSFLLNSQSNQSLSSDSESTSDNEHMKFYSKRAHKSGDDVLERPSDHEHNYSQSDTADDDDDNDNDNVNQMNNDRLTLSKNSRTQYLTREVTLYENNWPKKVYGNDEEFSRANYQNEVKLPDETSLVDLRQHRTVSLAS